MHPSDGTTSNNSHIYDDMAPFYRKYSENKSAYIEGVDNIIMSRIPDMAQSMLDIGAGDGVRGYKIARSRHISRLVLAEPSSAMAEKCRQQGVYEVWQLNAEDLAVKEDHFDIITCLWNVMGHIQDHNARLKSLQNMRNLLSKNGIIFLDVNNRYNASSYGYMSTLKRVVYDFIKPSEKNGDVSFDWNIEGRVIPSMGHFFTPAEIEGLIKEAGLKIVKRYIVDYRTGVRQRFIFEGQMLFEIIREG